MKITVSLWLRFLIHLYTLTVCKFSILISIQHFYDAHKENFLNDQGLLDLMTVSFILTTLTFDSDRYCWEKLDVYHFKGLKGSLYF